ncbi:MAG: tetratricopeptide repeat-containing sensor histidine kinase [Bacteroidales bacterium]|nr:tetratricopeptide repeat-containing sensor histidine kinase [Bacteroidales bacterium]
MHNPSPHNPLSRSLYREAFIAKPLSPTAFIANGFYREAFIAKPFIAEGFYREAFIAKPLSPKAFIAKPFIILLLLLLAIAPLQAQPTLPEKIVQAEQQIVSGALSDDEVFDKYWDLLWDYSDIDLEKAVSCFQRAIVFVREKKNVEQEAKLLTSMGDIYSIFDVRDSALFYLNKSLELIEGKGYYEEEYANHEARAIFYNGLRDYETALSFFLKGLEANEKDKAQKVANKKSIERPLRAEIRLLNNISVIYGLLHNVDAKTEHLLRAIKIMDDHPDVNFKSAKYQTIGSLAEVYIYTNQFDKAFPLIEESYRLSAASENLNAMVFASGRFARYYIHFGDFTKALDYGKQAQQIAEKTKQPTLLIQADKVLLEIYFQMKDYLLSLYHTECLSNRLKEEDWHNLQTVYLYSALNYAAMGNTSKASEYMTRYGEVISKVSDENMHNALQEMTVKYDVQQKELELIRKQTEIDRQTMIRNIFFIGLAIALLIVGLLITIVLQRNRLNRELVEMNSIKDKFFSIVSHDLKNPAIAQRDALQLLSENVTQWDTKTLSAYSQQLLKSATGLTDLLKNLLNWAQLQTGRETYHPTTFNLVAALQPDITLVKNMAERKNITFETQLPPTALITGDENMIITVIRNLLTNAVKFTPSDGMVKLEILSGGSGRDAINRVSTAGYTIIITDTGIGMSPEHLRNLFRLECAHSQPGTAGEKGTGLGILVCKEMIEKHDSILYVESEEGNGSKFWFEI